MLTVDDDGEGFRPEELLAPGRAEGLGLRETRQRALDLGGTFSVESAPGEGTRIRVEVPLTRAPAPAVAPPAR